MAPDTLAQEPQEKSGPQLRRLQTDIRPDAHERLRVEAARRECAVGVVVSDLAEQYLPLPSAQEPRS